MRCLLIAGLIPKVLRGRVINHFVEFTNDAEAQAAIAGLNGKEVSGRALTVSPARPKSEGGGGGNRGGGGGGGYGGGGGGRRNRY